MFVFKYKNYELQNNIFSDFRIIDIVNNFYYFSILISGKDLMSKN